MNVVLIGRYNASEILSGPEKFAKRLYKNLIKQNLSCEFIEYFFDGNKYSYKEKIFGHLIVSDNGFYYNKMGFLYLLIYLIRTKPKLIHLVTFERFIFIVLLYKLISKVKLVYTIHGIAKYENTLPLSVKNSKKMDLIKDTINEYLLFKISDRLVFLSERSIKLANQMYNYDQKKIRIIHHGVDKIYLTKQHKKYNKNFINIVFVGEINRIEKGFNKLLESISNSKLNINLHIVSNTRINFQLALNIRCYFYNKFSTDDYYKFLKDKDIFISSSYYEQFSISALEAIAAGLIPFFTYETGLSELTSNIKCGHYFKFNNLEEINNKLIDFTNNIELHSNNYNHLFSLIKKLTWEQTADLYSKEYETLM